MEPPPEAVTEEPTPTPASAPPPLVASGSPALEMEIADISAAEESGVWDWGNLLDFTIGEDDPLVLPWDSVDRPIPTAESSTAPVSLPPAQEVLPPPLTQTIAKTKGGLVRVRKRDPRLVCENFLAGRIPCACPEMDAMAEMGEEEEGELTGTVNGAARKKVKTAGPVVEVRCQVPRCEADIRELKGYHRRHRVCLRCANATSVILEGQSKRYCQQCGKFHILMDFDEGKRSCRRKLERHNKRRRRSTEYNVVVKDKELQNASCDGEQAREVSNRVARGSDILCISNKTTDAETSLESEDGPGSPFCSVPSVPTVQSISGVSFQASDASQMEERIYNSRPTISSSFGDNKSTYSTMCPTGRLSFKLYDWNPAEFPRRLRHQIFQWLASMPVELEGYIRPGCTILTVFIAMPQFMWKKFSEDAVLSLNDLVKAPESLFKGRRGMLIYFDNMIFQVMKDGTSLMNIKVEVQAPKLHYVYPNYFEAGKSMEFVACGSNLLQAKFRFLVSFAGKYLEYQSCEAISHGMSSSCRKNEKKLVQNSYHEVYKIKIPHTEPELFGPAFIEVENEAGISNFIPVLFGDGQICSELKRMIEPSLRPHYLDGIMSQIADASDLPQICDTYVSRQTLMSELLLDIAWLLKEPSVDAGEAFWSTIQIQRVNCLLKALIQSGSTCVLGKILHYLEILIDGNDLSNAVNGTHRADKISFGKYIHIAREVLHQKQCTGKSEIHSGNSSGKGVILQRESQCDMLYTVASIVNQDGETSRKDGVELQKLHGHHASEEDVSFVIKGSILRADYHSLVKAKSQQESWGNLFSRTRPRLAVLITVSVVMCFGLCGALLHPHKGRDFAVSVRTYVFGVPNHRRF